MDWLFAGAASAFWFGILTSISPCPLATNVAAMSFIGRRVGSPRAVLMSGLMYTAGRVLAYVVLGVVVVKGLLSIPGVALFLQRYMGMVLGPVLLVAGMFIAGLVRVRLSTGVSQQFAERVAARSGVLAPALLGGLFALSFCPVSAGLFFGSLVPLSVRYSSPVTFPVLYGIGTGLPVVAFAVVVALGAGSVGRWFNRVTQFEKWARRITGWIFIGVGVWFTLRCTLKLW
jgi:hypothetical protein